MQQMTSELKSVATIILFPERCSASHWPLLSPTRRKVRLNPPLKKSLQTSDACKWPWPVGDAISDSPLQVLYVRHVFTEIQLYQLSHLLDSIRCEKQSEWRLHLTPYQPPASRFINALLVSRDAVGQFFRCCFLFASTYLTCSSKILSTAARLQLRTCFECFCLWIGVGSIQGFKMGRMKY